MLRLHLLSRLATVGALLTLASPGCRGTTPKTTAGVRPVVSVIDAPVATETPVHWLKVAAPGVGVMFAAVARPQGPGPFPAVIILHGSHGFAQQYVQLAQAMSRGGVLGVAACWFTGGRGAGSRFITPIACPDGPPISDASSPVALQAVDALVQAVRNQPAVRPDRVALFGHSRGGGATLNYILRGGTVRAAVLNSAGYPGELAQRAPEIKVPILMLHGTADSPADGGSTFTDVQMARAFEAALQRAGARVEAKYYEGGRHNDIFTNAAQYDDEVQRMTAFLRRHLFN
ncbi:MAG TPA: dienelactone hydrolase family protein [Gemmatimonadaceae bacterium]|nr:dienelactone hydrolase family protein [Gemmatimonadaceae bacterium]